MMAAAPLIVVLGLRKLSPIMLVSINKHFGVIETYGKRTHLAAWDLEGYKEIVELPQWFYESASAISSDGGSFAWIDQTASSNRMCFGKICVDGDTPIVTHLIRDLNYSEVDFSLAFGCNDRAVYVAVSPLKQEDGYNSRVEVNVWDVVQNTVIKVDLPNVLKFPVSMAYQYSNVDVVPNPRRPDCFLLDVDCSFYDEELQRLFPYASNRAVNCPPIQGFGLEWLPDGAHLITWNTTKVFVYDETFAKVSEIEPSQECDIAVCKPLSNRFVLIVMQMTIFDPARMFIWDFTASQFPTQSTSISWRNHCRNILIPATKPLKNEKIISYESPHVSLTTLPPEIISKILGYLDFIDFTTASCACTVLRALSEQDSFYRTFALSARSGWGALMERIKEPEITWRDFYLRRARKLATSACLVSVQPPRHPHWIDAPQYLPV